MAAGTPVIASDLPVVRALAENDREALLVRPGSGKRQHGRRRARGWWRTHNMGPRLSAAGAGEGGRRSLPPGDCGAMLVKAYVETLDVHGKPACLAFFQKAGVFLTNCAGSRSLSPGNVQFSSSCSHRARMCCRGSLDVAMADLKSQISNRSPTPGAALYVTGFPQMSITDRSVAASIAGWNAAMILSPRRRAATLHPSSLPAATALPAPLPPTDATVPAARGSRCVHVRSLLEFRPRRWRWLFSRSSSPPAARWAVPPTAMDAGIRRPTEDVQPHRRGFQDVR